MLVLVFPSFPACVAITDNTRFRSAREGIERDDPDVHVRSFLGTTSEVGAAVTIGVCQVDPPVGIVRCGSATSGYGMVVANPSGLDVDTCGGCSRERSMVAAGEGPGGSEKTSTPCRAAASAGRPWEVEEREREGPWGVVCGEACVWGVCLPPMGLAVVRRPLRLPAAAAAFRRATALEENKSDRACELSGTAEA